MSVLKTDAATSVSQTARPALLALGVLVVLVIILFVPPLNYVSRQPSDYGLHLTFIEQLLNGEISVFITRVPHFLFHLLVVAVYIALPDLVSAAIIVSVVLYIGFGLSLYYALNYFLGLARTLDQALYYVLLTLLLMLIAPINLLTPDHQYLGYIAANVYHNPTITALKPFAVLLFTLAAAAFAAPGSVLSWRRLLLYASVTVLSIVAKPNYVLILLPALALFSLYYLVRRWLVEWLLLVVGIVLPAVAVLGIQVLVLHPSGIIVAPFEFFVAHDIMDGLLLKLLLSIAFPLAVYGLYFRGAVRSVYLNLAWLSFAAGAVMTYLLAEASRPKDGNFIWSGQIGVVILFVASLIFWVQQNYILSFSDLRKVKVTPAFVTTAVLMGFHLISGLLWYFPYASGIWPNW